MDRMMYAVITDGPKSRVPRLGVKQIEEFSSATNATNLKVSCCSNSAGFVSSLFAHFSNRLLAFVKMSRVLEISSGGSITKVTTTPTMPIMDIIHKACESFGLDPLSHALKYDPIFHVASYSTVPLGVTENP